MKYPLLSRYLFLACTLTLQISANNATAGDEPRPFSYYSSDNLKTELSQEEANWNALGAKFSEIKKDLEAKDSKLPVSQTKSGIEWKKNTNQTATNIREMQKELKIREQEKEEQRQLSAKLMPPAQAPQPAAEPLSQQIVPAPQPAAEPLAPSQQIVPAQVPQPAAAPKAPAQSSEPQKAPAQAPAQVPQPAAAPKAPAQAPQPAAAPKAPAQAPQPAAKPLSQQIVPAQKSVQEPAQQIVPAQSSEPQKAPAQAPAQEPASPVAPAQAPAAKDAPQAQPKDDTILFDHTITGQLAMSFAHAWTDNVESSLDLYISYAQLQTKNKVIFSPAFQEDISLKKIGLGIGKSLNYIHPITSNFSFLIGANASIECGYLSGLTLWNFKDINAKFSTKSGEIVFTPILGGHLGLRYNISNTSSIEAKIAANYRFATNFEWQGLGNDTTNIYTVSKKAKIDSCFTPTISLGYVFIF